MGKTNPRHKSRLRRKAHIRKSVHGTTERPRLSVFRSAKHIYAQIIDDSTGATLASASSVQGSFEGSGGNRDGAAGVGKAIAEQAKAADIGTVVFDRNGYLYHGRVAALADAAREGGLKF
ncbi:MAG: 50S ribosomal protein L18 [Proteobacteria bacterium]|nr:50S ribosomal protein L18 [Pseudomonadota bacterium]